MSQNDILCYRFIYMKSTGLLYECNPEFEPLHYDVGYAECERTEKGVMENASHAAHRKQQFILSFNQGTDMVCELGYATLNHSKNLQVHSTQWSFR